MRNIENLLSEQWILRVEHVDGVSRIDLVRVRDASVAAAIGAVPPARA